MITTDLIEAEKTRADPYLPYPLCCDDVKIFCLALATFVVVDMSVFHVEAENIYRPGVLILPCPDRSANVGKIFRKMPPPPKRGNPLCRQ